MDIITPVILSGGSGSRLWPLSRAGRPKQFIDLLDGMSLFQRCALRLNNLARYAHPWVICNEQHRFLAVQQLAEIEIQFGAIYIEPVGRNTAPALALAALEADPDDVLLLMPSDQIIDNEDSFQQAIDSALQAVHQGKIVTFGMKPDHPATSYGYIHKGDALYPGVFAVEGFTEKPDEETARTLLSTGEYFWNGGIFMARASDLIAAFESHAPDILESVKQATQEIKIDLHFRRLPKDLFTLVRSESIDYAVMEKHNNIAVVACDMGWSDLGSFRALAETASADPSGNRIDGDAVLLDTSNCYIRSRSRLVAGVGLKDLIIVDTDDAVMIIDKNNDQDVKRLVDRLKQDDREEALLHKKVYRPWGSYLSVAQGEGFQVKEIEVYPGKRLSLQYHRKRAEHWVIVAGEATVTIDDEQSILKMNQSVFIPLGATHRLENATSEPLILIEVQSGRYLGEDDIVRLADDFKRENNPV